MVSHLNMNKITIEQWGIECLDGVESVESNTMSYAENKAFFLKAVANPNIIILLTTEQIYYELQSYIKREITIFLTDNPRFYFWKIHNQYGERFKERIYSVEGYRGSNVKIHSTAHIDENVYLGDNVEVGVHAYIAANSYIGDNSYIGNGVVIGAQGLELAYNGYEKVMIRRYGGVRIANDVHIMDNSVVSKSIWGVTDLQDSVSIAVLCNIAANCIIGKATRMSGNCLVGGSAKLGENVILGPSVTIKDGISIGSNSRVRIGSVVVQSFPENSDISGNFAYNHTKNIRNFIKVKNG
ncbi:hypothetical protein LS70_003355 [Helicobacter sp. MIT 11-5569]|uniref:hypothetical protein n=1 Tax=Helicobacter sp. MIT 11-5569 TaxID=1548151 RepID=UPI00051FA0BF|nr:hypothetical protein [Helicobacter sp. MIT 11-5569]TLD84597.1 hypothetical protein LS70_003355 [Helicobacter sp. MIT 11-5569]